MSMMEPLLVHKVVGLVVYRLVHGCVVTSMAYRFNVGIFMGCKYMDIIIDVSSDE